MEGNKLKDLVVELFDILDTVEVNDSGVEFRPTYILSCRVRHTERLKSLIPQIKEALNDEA